MPTDQQYEHVYTETDLKTHPVCRTVIAFRCDQEVGTGTPDFIRFPAASAHVTDHPQIAVLSEHGVHM